MFQEGSRTCRQTAVRGTDVSRASEPRGWYLPHRAIILSIAPSHQNSQHFLAQRMHATTVEIDSGHLSMISHPQQISQLILDAARAASGQRQERPSRYLSRESISREAATVGRLQSPAVRFRPPSSTASTQSTHGGERSAIARDDDVSVRLRRPFRRREPTCRPEVVDGADHDRASAPECHMPSCPAAAG